MATIPRYTGTFRHAAGRAAPLARRVRPSPRRGREPRPARPRRRRALAHAPAGRALDRPGAARRQGPPARARRRLGPRPPLVARPDGAHAPAARRADDARLARLVRDLERRRRLAEADARAEPAPAPQRARQLRSPARRDHRQPRDAALALGHRQPQGRAERELRPRADGAVHARRGQRLHRARRPRAGARAHRLDEHVEARARARPTSASTRRGTTRATKTVFGKRGDVRLARLGLALRPPPEAPAVLRRQAVELLRPRPAGCEDAGRPRASSTSDGFEVRPVLEAILRHPALYTGPRMVKPPVVYIAGLLRGLGRGIDTTAWVWLAEGAGQRLFYPPNVAGWDDSRWLDTNTFRGRWCDRQHRAREGLARRPQGQEGAEGAERPRGDRQGRAGRARQPDDPARDARASCSPSRAARCKGATGWKAEAYPPLVANAVRQLLAVSPDLQTC